MRESWIDADDKTIRDDIVSIAKEKTGLTNFKNTGVLRGFLEVLAAVIFFVYKTRFTQTRRLTARPACFFGSGASFWAWRENRTIKRPVILPAVHTARAVSLKARGLPWKARNSATKSQKK